MQSEAPTTERTDSDDDFEALMQVLTRALRRLGEAGQPEDANRLAARAWSAIRHQHPAEAERINGTMHYLSRLPGKTPAPHLDPVPGRETA